MIANRSISDHTLARIQAQSRRARYMIPQLPRREWHQVAPLAARSDMWWMHDVHPEIHGALRRIAELILWLIAVLAVIWLSAELWS